MTPAAAATPTQPPAPGAQATTKPEPAAAGHAGATITTTRNWGLIGKSVAGARHTRGCVENQDAIQWFPVPGLNADTMPLIMTVSDGHGSERYIRSARGSKYAAQAAIRVLRLFYKEYGMTRDPAQMKARAEAVIPERLVESWREMVQEDLDQNPFTQSELSFLGKLDPLSRGEILSSPMTAYGSTVLATMVTPWCVLYAALGDGDFVCGTVDRQIYRPFPKETGTGDTMFTDSLVGDNAVKAVKIACESADNPVIILMSTDGYYNSFKNEAEYQKIVPDYLKMIAGYGDQWQQRLGDDLENILRFTSEHGSGDDITLALIHQSRAGIVRGRSG